MKIIFQFYTVAWRLLQTSELLSFCKYIIFFNDVNVIRFLSTYNKFMLQVLHYYYSLLLKNKIM